MALPKPIIGIKSKYYIPYIELVSRFLELRFSVTGRRSKKTKGQLSYCKRKADLQTCERQRYIDIVSIYPADTLCRLYTVDINGNRPKCRMQTDMSATIKLFRYLRFPTRCRSKRSLPQRTRRRYRNCTHALRTPTAAATEAAAADGSEMCVSADCTHVTSNWWISACVRGRKSGISHCEKRRRQRLRLSGIYGQGHLIQLYKSWSQYAARVYRDLLCISNRKVVLRSGSS